MSRAKRYAVFIHGLPSIGHDPIEQLDALRFVCLRRGVTVVPFRWVRPTLGGIVEVARQLKRHDASFALTHAVDLQMEVFAQLPDDAHILVNAYSLGGAIFIAGQQRLLSLAS